MSKYIYNIYERKKIKDIVTICFLEFKIIFFAIDRLSWALWNYSMEEQKQKIIIFFIKWKILLEKEYENILFFFWKHF